MRKIAWKRWTDPLLPLFIKGAEPNLEEPDTTDLIEKDYDPLGLPHPSKGFGPAITGPMGIIPIGESNLPSKNFDFWEGHTNFNIDMFFRDVVSLVEGVETLDIFTRYRFRISVGKLFDNKEVRQVISRYFGYDYSNSNSGKTIYVDSLVKVMEKKGGPWAIYQLDGKLNVVRGNKEKVDGTIETVLMAGGQCVARSN